ncbi:DMT family transporter [Sulfitobacter mediterraneus]|uniref:DMT family transporter n=1 Tax=Sulfitobacter mediterraneus TaxID=83219 RepID=UPI0019325C98|nr:DMT family transporter [Sulfitobacter mediterraneus]MBM1309663.1 DMT family transporter [Sulfitobacter mediterraneus]MBM1313548.1 DMT family transporter [Sulfitobacter mediterraneus]MBM1321932.1 DMT family transporter [Sulfitobacter mediterraneus]MBM1325819.1 DMT family transporter [Sulfitobacter mediterraneus]MBM1397165.1 DMT family transporter [Sulfitobacter mediterraneus]
MDKLTSAKRDATTYAFAVAGVLFGSICFGFVPYFSHGLTDQGLAPYAVAFYRYILAAIILLPALLMHRSKWREIVWGMVAGAVIGLGWVGYVTALETVPASTVGVLYMTYPVFTIIIAWAIFGDQPARRGLVAAGLIIIAAIIAGSPTSVLPDQIPTLLVSLAAPFGFGFGICVLVHRLSRIAPLARIASVSLGSVIGLAPLILSSEVGEVLPKGGNDWFLIVGIGLVTALIPQLVYTVCSPVIGATRTAVIGSIELPTMLAVGVLAFGEVITGAQAVACALVLGAIALTQSRTTRAVSTVISKESER